MYKAVLERKKKWGKHLATLVTFSLEEFIRVSRVNVGSCVYLSGYHHESKDEIQFNLIKLITIGFWI